MENQSKVELAKQKIANGEDFVFLGEPGKGNVQALRNGRECVSIMAGALAMDVATEDSGAIAFIMDHIEALCADKDNNYLLLLDCISNAENPEILLDIVRTREIAGNKLPNNAVIGLYDICYNFDKYEEIVANASFLEDLLNKDMQQ